MFSFISFECVCSAVSLNNVMHGVDVDTFSNNMFWLVWRAVIVARDLVHKNCYFSGGGGHKRTNKQTRACVRASDEWMKWAESACSYNNFGWYCWTQCASTSTHNHTYNHSNREPHMCESVYFPFCPHFISAVILFIAKQFMAVFKYKRIQRKFVVVRVRVYVWVPQWKYTELKMCG